MSGSDQVLCDLNERFEEVCLAKDEDFFSNLPESLISCILSCLPTKDAVRTSVLSKDWEYRWTTIYNFHITCESSLEQMATFVKFVDRVLLQAQVIKCFKLFFSEECNDRPASWIHAALRHKIEVLCLYNMRSLKDVKQRDDDGVCFLNSISLRDLGLLVPHFQVSAEICLPNLTTLDFNYVRILNESSNTNHLKYTFPFLKTLRLVSCKWLKVKLVEINAPELTTFFSAYAEGEDGFSIKVIADKLKNFYSDCSLPDEAIVTGSRVVDATFTYRGPIGDDGQIFRKKGLQVWRLLKGFSSLMKLELSRSMVEAMREWRLQFPFPRFVKLAQLDLEVPIYSEVLLELLHAAPYLKFIKISVTGEKWLEHNDYDEVQSVPSCVVSHLEEVLFICYKVENLQHHLANFFLKNGSKLKKFHVLSSKLSSDEILENICAFPKASTNLTINKVNSSEALYYILRKWKTRY